MAKAKERLMAKIASENAAMTSKGEEKGEDTHGNSEETVHGSPSNTVISWLHELIIIASTLGVQTLH